MATYNLSFGNGFSSLALLATKTKPENYLRRLITGTDQIHAKKHFKSSLQHGQLHFSAWENSQEHTYLLIETQPWYSKLDCCFCDWWDLAADLGTYVLLILYFPMFSYESRYKMFSTFEILLLRNKFAFLYFLNVNGCFDKVIVGKSLINLHPYC